MTRIYDKSEGYLVSIFQLSSLPKTFPNILVVYSIYPSKCLDYFDLFVSFLNIFLYCFGFFDL